MSDPLPALHTLLAHLEARVRRSEQRAWMSPAARTALKEIIRMKPGRMVLAKPKAEPAARAATPVPVDSPLAPVHAPGPPAAPAPVIAQKRPVESPAPPQLSTEEKRQRLAAVAARAEAAPAARKLGTLRDRMIFATGNPNSPIVFVGEAPGADEEKQGEPFVGVAGQLLNRVLKAMGFERSDVYITNICKFRPITDDGKPQGTRNRQPTDTEMNACIEFVQEELAIIQPKVIVALGKTAVEGLLQRDVAITRLRGQWQEYRGIPLMPTFHPSYLKRKEDEGETVANAEKRKHWEDMLQVMEKLSMTITEKQRRFFLPKTF
jgi:uracil-DNA glycosylase family 4